MLKNNHGHVLQEGKHYWYSMSYWRGLKYEVVVEKGEQIRFLHNGYTLAFKHISEEATIFVEVIK